MSNNALASGTNGLRLTESVSAMRRPLDLAVFVLLWSIGGYLVVVAGIKADVALVFGEGSRTFWLVIRTVGFGVLFIAYASVCARFTDEAVGGVARGMGHALVSAVLVTPKAIVTGLIFLVAYLILLIPAALLLLLCQIPGLGPKLQLLIFPVVAAVLGLGLYLLIFVIVRLAICALMQGRSVFGTVAFVLAGLRSRLTDLVHKFLVADFIGWVVLGVLLLMAGFGIAITEGLISSIQANDAPHMGGDLGDVLGLLGPYGDRLARLLSGGAGAGVLLGIAFLSRSVVSVKGWSLIYAELDGQVDSSREEAALRAGYAQAKEKAKELQDKAQVKAKEFQEQAQRQAREVQDQIAARNAARQAGTPTAPPQSAASTSSCSQCNGPLSADDGVCGNCGAPVARNGQGDRPHPSGLDN